jgi:hypothetical protein
LKLQVTESIASHLKNKRKFRRLFDNFPGPDFSFPANRLAAARQKY